MKKKSFSKKFKKNKNEIKEVKTKEIGTMYGFTIIEKLKDEKNNKKEEKNEIKEAKEQMININISNTLLDEKSKEFFSNWIIFENPNQKESRFLQLFKELKEMDKNEKQDEKEEKNEKGDIREEEEPKKERENEDEFLDLNDYINDNNSGYDPSDENNSRKSIDYNINLYYEEKKLEEKKKLIEEELNLDLIINDIISQKDKRSTVMIKNIPNKFNQEYILNIINQNFRGTFDIFVLPTDINKLKNFGYAFINFTSSYYIPYFYFLFNGKMWFGTNSKKICELAFSKVQGKEALLEHYPSKIVFNNNEALEVTNEQRYIIPNIYKLYFNECFPKEKIEEYKYYFITRMPN